MLHTRKLLIISHHIQASSAPPPQPLALATRAPPQLMAHATRAPPPQPLALATRAPPQPLALATRAPPPQPLALTTQLGTRILLHHMQVSSAPSPPRP
jgi:hypothetical protein